MSISTKLIRSVLIEKVLEDFRSLYAKQFGECFRTEIRDTGVFICGVHQSRVWEDPEGDCAELEELCTLIEAAFAESLDRSVATPNPSPNPPIPPTKTNPFDGTRWPRSRPPAPRPNPSGKSMRDEAIDLWDNPENEPTRDSYNVPI